VSSRKVYADRWFLKKGEKIEDGVLTMGLWSK